MRVDNVWRIMCMLLRLMATARGRHVGHDHGGNGEETNVAALRLSSSNTPITPTVSSDGQPWSSLTIR